MIFATIHFAELALLGLLFVSTGFLIQRCLPQLRVADLGEVPVRLMLGLWLWMLLMMGLAFVGLLRAVVVFAIALGLLSVSGVAAALSFWRRPQGAANTLEPSTIAASLILMLPVLATGIAFLFRCLTPGVGWDDNVYHLTLPKLYIAHGGFRNLPFSVYSHWPHAVELIFGLALMLNDYLLAKLIHAGFALATLYTTYRLCRAQGSVATALAATLLLVSNEALISEASVAYVDIACAFFFLVAVAAADAYLKGEGRGALLVSGLACAALAMSKLTGIAGAACIGLWLLCVRARRRLHREAAFDLRAALVEGATIGLPALLALAPWLVKSYVYTGNPLYPLFFERFGGANWTAELGQQFSNWQDAIGAGRGWLDYLRLPYRVCTRGARGYANFDNAISSFWLAAVPFAALSARYVKASRSYLACAGIYFVFWALTSQQMRFLIPILPLMAIATTMSFDWVIASVNVQEARSWLRAGCYVAILSVCIEPLWPTWTDGWADASRILHDGQVDLNAAAGEGYRFVNTHTPVDAKLMLAHVNLGFFLDREYISDSFFEASQMKWLVMQAHTKQELQAVLRARGITHVYLGQDRWGIGYPKLLDELLNDPAAALRLYSCRSEYCVIYQLLWEPAWHLE